MTQTGPGMGRVALFDIHSILCIVTATSPGLALVLALFELSNNEHLNQNQHWNLTALRGSRPIFVRENLGDLIMSLGPRLQQQRLPLETSSQFTQDPRSRLRLPQNLLRNGAPA